MERANQHHLIRLGICLLLLAIPVIAFATVQAFYSPAQVVQAAALYQTTPQVSFTSASYSVGENDGSISINVQIDISSTTDVSVEYLTVDGTATAGSDYVSASGVLTFPASSTASQQFSISITDDSTDEPDETVNLILRNPVSATLGTNDTAVLTITDDDPTPATSTPTATPGGAIFVDAYEPNDAFGEAYTTASDAAALCSVTLWPTGDIDYFRFTGKAGSAYVVFTTIQDTGIDTFLTVYDTQFNVMATNDDYQIGDRSSKVTINANVDGFYYASITNQDPSDPADKTYCFEVDEVAPATLTPSPTPIGGDECEFNSTFETACLLGTGETKNLSFVPVYGSLQDTDVFRLWMKPGIEYTCETSNLSSVADTNMIFFDANGNDFNPQLGNDDKEPGDLGSKLSYLSTYTGWLYIMVGPVNPPPYEEASLHTYSLTCTASAATATPTPTATFPPPPPSGNGGAPTATPTPLIFPTFPPTPTPIDLSGFVTATPQLPPVIQFQPLPTATPFAVEQQSVAINVTLYYDKNFNYMPELTEGIRDVAVALYDNATGQLIAFGYTNEAGMLRFDSITTSGTVRVVVPFLNYSQVVVGDSSNILLRVAPQPLPGSIP